MNNWKEQLTKQIIAGFTDFTTKPIGTIEGDLCDWNSPRYFADGTTPAEVEKRVAKRAEEVAKQTCENISTEIIEKLIDDIENEVPFMVKQDKMLEKRYLIKKLRDKWL